MANHHLIIVRRYGGSKSGKVSHWACGALSAEPVKDGRSEARDTAPSFVGEETAID